MRTLNLIFVFFIAFSFSSCNDGASSRIKKENVEKAKEMQEQLNAGAPEMTFEKTKHDFGDLKQGDKVETVFKFKNTGESPLIITNARSSCGCTIPDYPQTPVMPGDEGEIKVVFNSAGKRGKQNKQVTLTTNTEKGREVFYVLADVKAKENK